MIAVYLVIINIVAFVAFDMDKGRARADAWRIPEGTLMALALFGGSIGAIAGMKVFRHKTKKMKFSIGIPLIMVIQFFAAWYFLFEMK